MDDQAESGAPAPVTPEFCPIEVIGQTDVGCRRTENQDAFADFQDELGYRLLVVADGMGGHQGGATASRICVETLGEAFRASSEPLPDRIRCGLERANEQILEVAASDSRLEGMGTTAVVLAFTPRGEAVVAWVGDSRAYRLREGQLEQLTEDHSLVAEMVRQGMISPEEAVGHPRRNELLRSVGVHSGAEVEVRRIDARPGDRFLLCSDGLCGELPAAAIAEELAGDPVEAAAVLIEKANRSGGPDNITVQIATLGERRPLVLASDDTPRPANRRVPPALWPAVAAGLALLLVGWIVARPSGDEHSPPSPSLVERVPPAQPEAHSSPPPRETLAEEAAAPTELSTEATPPALETTPALALEADLAVEPDPEQAVEIATSLAIDPKPSTEIAPLEADLEAIEVPALEPDPERAIEAFLESWSRAATARDYSLYERLGFELSEAAFAEKYGERRALELRLVLFEWNRDGPDRLAVRVQATTAYEEGGLSRRIEEERKLLLRETEAGLRYAGRWE